MAVLCITNCKYASRTFSFIVKTPDTK